MSVQRLPLANGLLVRPGDRLRWRNGTTAVLAERVETPPAGAALYWAGASSHLILRDVKGPVPPSIRAQAEREFRTRGRPVEEVEHYLRSWPFNVRDLVVSDPVARWDEEHGRWLRAPASAQHAALPHRDPAVAARAAELRARVVALHAGGADEREIRGTLTQELRPAASAVADGSLLGLLESGAEDVSVASQRVPRQPSRPTTHRTGDATGGRARRGGIYRSDCACRRLVTMQPGGTFPPCGKCRRGVGYQRA